MSAISVCYEEDGTGCYEKDMTSVCYEEDVTSVCYEEDGPVCFEEDGSVCYEERWHCLL